MAHKEIIPIAHVTIRDRGYNAYVSLNTMTHALHVFKYDEDSGICIYEVFDDHSQVEEFLAAHMPKTKPKHY
jgi:hypothetical protein